MKKNMYLVIKRIMDIFLASAAGILLLPVVLLLICWIKADSKGPVFFRQKRVGIHKSYFYLYKFRTMRREAPGNVPTHMLKEPEKYITNAGKFLRRTSLDELPQLINILKGQMSLVGPRPALWNQYDLIAERDKYGANDIRPGLTGWAQINGRDELEIPVKARLDGEYAEKMGLWFDLTCLAYTMRAVLCQNGVLEGGTGRKNK